MPIILHPRGRNGTLVVEVDEGQSVPAPATLLPGDTLNLTWNILVGNGRTVPMLLDIHLRKPDEPAPPNAYERVRTWLADHGIELTPDETVALMREFHDANNTTKG